MSEYDAIEYGNILNENRKIKELLKKGELLKCKKISSKKLYNAYQLLLKKDLKDLGEKDVRKLIEKESVLIFDLREKSEISRSGIMINNSIDCNNSFEKVISAFDALYNDITIQNERKNIILYDENGDLLEQEEQENTKTDAEKGIDLSNNKFQNKVKYYFKKSIKFVKNIYILKGGFRDFYYEFPFLCCPISEPEDIESISISKYKSMKDIPDCLKSRIIASMEYPIIVSWGQDFKIYLANVIQGCHPHILKALNIKTVFDLTPNKIEDNGNDSNIKLIHIKKNEYGLENKKGRDTNNKQITEIPLLEETINALKELEMVCNYKEIFPLIIVSTNITNEIVSISAVIVSYLRKWKITPTLVFLLGQLCLDNHLITPTENKEIYNKIHPTNHQITNMLSFEFI
ncbi:hypothetical protein FG379_001055 [Cryptosporidium bovis]|uniref:uncharacterized protein n=1 Tax=Cryptosporidium bovis TaxID=310047 RepID=UPI00351A9730|nr:hypothetical protein FG379_001055 [Cryptosporidium bovis]